MIHFSSQNVNYTHNIFQFTTTTTQLEQELEVDQTKEQEENAMCDWNKND